MLSSDEIRFAIEDARTRHFAIIDLVKATDQQALALLALYVTLGLASASASASIGGSEGSLVPKILIWPLAGAALSFIAGAFFCLRTLESTKISLPGREADFWIWANRPDVNSGHAFAQYLDNLKDKHELNNEINRRTTSSMNWARRFGLAAPVVSLSAGTISVGTQMI